MASIGKIFVPFVGPETARIALVGEAPGGIEELEQEPFVGDSGNKMEVVLGRNALSRSEVWLGNLSHYRPFPRNDFRSLLDSKQLKDGIADLTEHLITIQPNIIVALGSWPLYYLTGKRGNRPGWGIDNWRGSLLPCILPGLEGMKVLPTYHPAYILRDRKKYPIFDTDIKFAKSESAFPDIKEPVDDFIINPKGAELKAALDLFMSADVLSCDIETYGMEIACIGFGLSDTEALCFGDLDKVETRGAAQELLMNVPLVFHFGTYDTIVLEDQDYEIADYFWDTMVAQHVMWPELPKSLAYLNSVFTYPRRPYYKHERKAEAVDTKSWSRRIGKETLMTYNCKDDCVTIVAHLKMQMEMNTGPKEWQETFDFEMSEVRGPAKAMAKAGFLVDEERRAFYEKALTYKWAGLQRDLNKLVGTELNANSPLQVMTLLYDVLKLPEHKNEEGNRTADDDALISLLNFTKTKHDSVVKKETKQKWLRQHIIVKLIKMIRGVRKVISSYITIKISDDGRIRSTWKVPTVETGRWAAEKFVDGTGLNSQTFPRDPIEIEDDIMKMIEEEKNGLG